MAKTIENTSKKHTIASLLQVLIGNGGYVALGFVANIVAANGMGPTDFGLLSLSLAVLTVLQEVCGSGIDIAMVKLSAQYWHDNRRRSEMIFRTTLQIKLLINCLIAVVLWLSSDYITAKLLQNPEMSTPLKLTSIGIIGSTLTNYLLAKFQAQERLSLYAGLKVFSNLIKLLILGALWWLHLFDSLYVISAWMGSFFLCFVMGQLWDRYSRIKFSRRLKKTIAKKVIYFAKWTIASHLLFAVYSRVDFFLLAKFWSATEVGIYSVAWNLNFVIDLVTYSIVTALLPKASRMKTKAEFISYSRHIFVICIVISICFLPVYFIADWLIELAFPKYIESISVFRILFWGGIITLLIHPLYLILYAKDKVKILTYIDFGMVIICFVLGYHYIPLLGVEGAAYITVLGRVISSCLILFFVAKEILNIPAIKL